MALKRNSEFGLMLLVVDANTIESYSPDVRQSEQNLVKF